MSPRKPHSPADLIGDHESKYGSHVNSTQRREQAERFARRDVGLREIVQSGKAEFLYELLELLRGNLQSFLPRAPYRLLSPTEYGHDLLWKFNYGYEAKRHGGDWVSNSTKPNEQAVWTATLPTYPGQMPRQWLVDKLNVLQGQHGWTDEQLLIVRCIVEPYFRNVDHSKRSVDIAACPFEIDQLLSVDPDTLEALVPELNSSLLNALRGIQASPSEVVAHEVPFAPASPTEGSIGLRYFNVADLSYRLQSLGEYREELRSGKVNELVRKTVDFEFNEDGSPKEGCLLRHRRQKRNRDDFHQRLHDLIQN